MSLILPSSELVIPQQQPILTSITDVHESKKRRKMRPIKTPLSVQNAYLMQLNKIIKKMHQDTYAILMPALKRNESRYRGFTADSWVDDILNAMKSLDSRYSSFLFDSIAEVIAKRMVISADNYNKRKAASSFGINALKEQSTQDFLKLSIQDNVSLITSIPERHFESIEQAVMRQINEGARYTQIENFINNRYEVTRSRARLIARDQTAKVNGQLTARRQANVGIEYFRWVTVHDERVRDTHERLQDRITEFGRGVYKWSDPPEGQKGRKIIPGYEFQCRCFAEPLFTDDVESGALF